MPRLTSTPQVLIQNERLFDWHLFQINKIIAIMQFTFPLEEIPRFHTLQQAKTSLNAMLAQQNLASYCRYRFQQIRGIYIYCRCQSCSARLVYRKIDGRFVLVKQNTHHKHRKLTTSKYMMIEAIQNYPACFNTQTIKQQIMARFNISAATFYRRLRESESFGDNLHDVLAALESEGIFGVTINSQNQELPSLLLLTSELMIQRYHENGRNVKFDLTYNLVREKTDNDQQYAVGVFLSLSNNLNIEPHCLVIMADQSKMSFVRVFTEFIMLMKQSPKIITTDEQKNMKLALEELAERNIFTGYHFIDVFHVLRNAKKALFNKTSINFLVSLSRSQNILEYQNRRLICADRMFERDKEVLNKFQQKMERCCLALLPPTFVGLSCTTACSQKINDIIKSKLPYSQKYLTVVGKISKLLLQMVKQQKEIIIQKMKLEQFMIIDQIEQLRMRLNKRVFRKLMLQLSISATCLVNLTQNPNSYQVKDQDFEEANFLVKFNPQGKWQCECELSLKIGLPCAHILKIILLLKQKIVTSIDSWWLCKSDSRTDPKATLRRPRKTRRLQR